MIKRISLVWKHQHLSDAEFRQLWLGEHVDVARRIPGVREYTIDFVRHESARAPDRAPNGIATLRFDSRAALDAAFSDSQLNDELRRTREIFAERVQVMIVDEHTVLPRTYRNQNDE